jgi:hypothetical protein
MSYFFGGDYFEGGFSVGTFLMGIVYLGYGRAFISLQIYGIYIFS